jgi:hypothetical protein
MFFQQTHHILSLRLTWADTVHIVNGVYVLGHVFVTLGVALWVYFYRRDYFRFLRNTIILVNGLALIVYESFPVAPPRLTTDLVFNHHPFTFQDTVFGIVSGSGKLIGTQVGYNEFSAMPSVHMAWAVVVGATLVLLARSPMARLFGMLYPAAMLVAVVVTGNHYLMDAAAALLVVIVAAAGAGAYERWRPRNPRPDPR